jgi:hypothetical protein
MTQPRIALGSMGLPLLAGILVLMGIFAPASAADTTRVEAEAQPLIYPVQGAKASPVCKAVVRCSGCKPVYRRRRTSSVARFGRLRIGWGLERVPGRWHLCL